MRNLFRRLTPGKKKQTGRPPHSDELCYGLGWLIQDDNRIGYAMCLGCGHEVSLSSLLNWDHARMNAKLRQFDEVIDGLLRRPAGPGQQDVGPGTTRRGGESPQGPENPQSLEQEKEEVPEILKGVVEEAARQDAEAESRHDQVSIERDEPRGESSVDEGTQRQSEEVDDQPNKICGAVSKEGRICNLDPEHSTWHAHLRYRPTERNADHPEDDDEPYLEVLEKWQ